MIPPSLVKKRDEYELKLDLYELLSGQDILDAFEAGAAAVLGSTELQGLLVEVKQAPCFCEGDGQTHFECSRCRSLTQWQQFIGGEK